MSKYELPDLPWPKGIEKLKVALKLLDEVYITEDLERMGMTEEDTQKLVHITESLYKLLFKVLNPEKKEESEEQECIAGYTIGF